MNINLTLIVQIINFWVVFFVLRRLFWRPALLMLEQEDHEKEALEESLMTQRKVIARNENRREQLWNDARQQFLNAIPTVSAVAPTEFAAEKLVIAQFDVAQQNAVVQQVAHLIMEKAEHVQS